MRLQGPRSSSFFKNYGTVALGTCKGGCPRGNPDPRPTLRGSGPQTPRPLPEPPRGTGRHSWRARPRGGC